MVTSFMPSGIQTLVMQGVPRRRPKASPILRQAMPCSIQNRRMPASRWAKVKPSAAFGCEKYVGLKSKPMPNSAAQSIQRWKCAGAICVPLHRLAAVLQVDRVQAEAVLAGDQAHGLGGVGPKFVGVAGPAGIIARGHDPAAAQSAGALEAGHVVALPALHRDGDVRQPLQGRVGVHAQFGITLLGQPVRFVDRIGSFHDTEATTEPSELLSPPLARSSYSEPGHSRRLRPCAGRSTGLAGRDLPMTEAAL